MNHKYCAESETTLIRPLHQEDIEKLRVWRNDPQLSKFLSSVPFITEEMQKQWFDRYLSDLDTLFFAVVDKTSNKHVGSVAIYGFKDNSCEIGRIVIGDSSSHGKGIGYGSLLLAMAVAIQVLGIHTITLDVHEDNEPAKRIYEKAGFRIIGNHQFVKGGYELEMFITSEQFYLVNESAKDILVFMEDENMSEKFPGGDRNNRINHGYNCVIDPDSQIGEGVIIGHNCIIERDVVISDRTQIDSNTIIRSGTKIGKNCFIGSNCIIGEYQNDYIRTGEKKNYRLLIGDNALIRSGSIIYSNSIIGNSFQTGHQVTIREQALIGNNVSVGTLSDIQGICKIGNYVRLHSNVHIGQHSVIEDYVWIFPYVVLTNDPTPPSDKLIGVHIHSFAIVATGSIILPGVEVGQDALIGAGAIVTKNVGEYRVAVGNPAKEISDVRKINNKFTGEPAYPWRHHYSNNMPWNGQTFEEWYSSLSLESKFEIN